MLIFPKYSRLVGLVGYRYGYCLVSNEEAYIQPPFLPTSAIFNYGVEQKILDAVVIPELIKRGMLKTIYNYYVDICLSKIETFRRFDEYNVPHPRVIPLEEVNEHEHVLLRIDRLSRQTGMYYSTYPHERIQKLQETKHAKHLFAVEPLDLYAEFRAYVWKDSVLDVSPHIRIPPDADALLRTYQDVIWTYAVTALQATMLDMGAVDIGICRDGRLVIFETNSRFGVTDTEQGRMIAELVKALITDG